MIIAVTVERQEIIIDRPGAVDEAGDFHCHGSNAGDAGRDCDGISAARKQPHFRHQTPICPGRR